MMRIFNVAMRRILGLLFPTPIGRRLMLVRLPGRKTSRIYRQPVSYIRHGKTLLTPGGRWTLNLVNDEAVPIRLLGRDVTAKPELISDPDQVEQLVEMMVQANPDRHRVRSHTPRSARQLRPHRARDHDPARFRIVRWHLKPQRSARSHLNRLPSDTVQRSRLARTPGSARASIEVDTCMM